MRDIKDIKDIKDVFNSLSFAPDIHPLTVRWNSPYLPSRFSLRSKRPRRYQASFRKIRIFQKACVDFVEMLEGGVRSWDLAPGGTSCCVTAAMFSADQLIFDWNLQKVLRVVIICKHVPTCQPCVANGSLPGDVLLEDGKVSSDAYILCDGAVEIVKEGMVFTRFYIVFTDENWFVCWLSGTNKNSNINLGLS